ncbi:hypothetical protein [Paenibacillus sp. USDA918EY]|uniref:hypothetical protein n=1 Tax=Paenibacillus sp. USDA918EY TaxID=2689575 RepID=UPI00135768DC|nr:hypothetical protein [Paenibacillus sp. USDA918EY]
MLGNTNKAPHGFKPDSVRGELPGQPGAGMEKIQAGIMQMIQNMNANALEAFLCYYF